MLVTAIALATYKGNTVHEQEPVQEKLPYALDSVSKGNKKLPSFFFFRRGGLGRARQQDAEMRVKPDHSPELFTLVKGVAGVKDATAKGESEDRD